MNIIAVASLFKQFGYESNICLDGSEAMEAVMTRHFAKKPMYKIILMDYSMPECNGPESTMLIRKFLKDVGIERNKQPVICCLSAYSEEEFQKKSIESGMDMFLAKPIFKKHINQLLTKTNLIK